MKTYTIAKRGKGNARNAVIMRKGGRVVAQFCQEFLPNLWTLTRGEKSLTVVVSAESVDPEQEWKITVLPWNGGAERVIIDQCSAPGPHRIWPSLAGLLRDACPDATDRKSTIVYVMHHQNENNKLEIPNLICHERP